MSGHLVVPLRLAPDGTFATVAEDSVQEVVQCAQVVLRSRAGDRLATPDLGIADPAFGRVDLQQAAAEVERWEPRADIRPGSQALAEEGVDLVEFFVVGRRGDL